MSRRLCVCATVIALCHAGGAVAGGLWLNEFGDFSGGRAAAGAAAGVDEAITIVYNPASITSLEGNHLFAAGGAYVGKSKFKTSKSKSNKSKSQLFQVQLFQGSFQLAHYLQMFFFVLPSHY